MKDENYQADGYYGGKVWSRGDWMNFLRWFENAIHIYSDRQVINATEGGARIKGTSQRSLKEIIASLPDNHYNFSEIISNPRVAINEEEYANLLVEHKKNFDDIYKIRELGYDQLFFSWDYEKIPVMRLVIDYMKSLDDVMRKERFEKALEYVEECLLAVKDRFPER